MRRALGPLRDRAFRLLIAGQVTSNLGDAFYAVALPWYVLAARRGALLLGSLLAVYGVSRTLTLAIGGHATDRWRPWTVMMSADLLRAIAIGGLAVTAALAHPHLEVLAPIAAVLGAGAGLFLPGSFSIAPSLLPDERLQAGNALSFGGTELALVVGPAIGGAIVALLGPSLAFALDGGSFLVSALTLAGVRTRRATSLPATASPTASASDPAPTLRSLLATEPVLWIIFAIVVAANLGSGGMSEVALPALAQGPFEAGAAGYGALIAAFGAGALGGTLLAARTHDPQRPAIVASAAFGLQCAFIAATPYLGGVVPAAIMLACYGTLNGFANVLTLTAMQRWAPAGTAGRVMSFVLLGSLGIFPVSVLLGGIVVHMLGPAPFFPLAGAAVAITMAGALLTPQWRNFGAREPHQLTARPPEPTASTAESPHRECAGDGTLLLDTWSRHASR